MKPSELQKLNGRYLVPNVPGRNADVTARFHVVGFGADVIRVQSTAGIRSTLALSALDAALESGYLVIVD